MKTKNPKEGNTSMRRRLDSSCDKLSEGDYGVRNPSMHLLKQDFNEKSYSALEPMLQQVKRSSAKRRGKA